MEVNIKLKIISLFSLISANVILIPFIFTFITLVFDLALTILGTIIYISAIILPVILTFVAILLIVLNLTMTNKPYKKLTHPRFIRNFTMSIGTISLLIYCAFFLFIDIIPILCGILVIIGGVLYYSENRPPE